MESKLKFKLTKKEQMVTWEPTESDLTEQEANIVNSAQIAWGLRMIAESLDAVAKAIKERG